MSKKQGNTKKQTRAPSQRKTVPRSNEEAVRDAARLAVKAAVSVGIAIVRKNLKKRSHRAPSDQKVQAHFLAWVKAGGFADFANEKVHAWMREMESCFGKPSQDWALEERRKAYDFVAECFLLLAESCERPKGRPRRQRESFGIIADAMLEGEATRRKQEKDELKEIERRFFAWERPAKLAVLARREEKQYLEEGHSEAEAASKFSTHQAMLEYMEDADIDWSEVLEQHLPPGWFQKFLIREGIDLKHEAAVKMRISRGRRSRS